MRRLALLLSTALLTIPHGVRAETADPAVGVLLRQADFWLQQNRPQMAANAAERVLAVTPGNVEALSLGARAEAALGHREAAAAYLARLRTVTPDPAVQREAAAALHNATIDPAALEAARQLARQGRTAEAAARYRSLFAGSPPPAYALEYYQTLAGTEGGFDEGRAGLGRLVTQSPADRRRQLAYAQTLTYHDATRDEGVARLAALAANPDAGEDAARAWRQALSWDGTGPRAIAGLEAYLQRFPQDTAAAQRLAELRRAPPPAAGPPDPVAAARIAGYGSLDAGRLADAAARFRTALASKPDDAESVGGLGLVLLRQGHLPEAHQMLERAIALAPERRTQWQQALDGSVPPPPVRRVAATVADDTAARSAALRREATSAPDPVAVLQRALSLTPSDPWVRLDLARALARQGQGEQARSLVEAPLATRPSNEALQAAALFADEQGRAADARDIVQRIPPGQRSAAMNALVARTQTSGEIDAAESLARAGQTEEARRRLLALAAQPDPGGTRLPAVLGAFIALRDATGATEAAALARRSGAGNTPAARVALASAMFAAGQDVQAASLLQGLDENTPGLDAGPARDLRALRAGLAVRASDRLNASGDRAAAYASLQPVLSRDPDNKAASLALARLYAGDRQPEQARRIAEAVLARDPTSLDARATAIDTALAAHDRARAQTLLVEGYALHPDAARMMLLEARVARAAGDDARAVRLLRAAAARRQQELASGSSDNGADAAPEFAPDPFSSTRTPATLLAANPFQSPQPTIQNPTAAVAQDDVSASIAAELAALQSDTSTVLVGSAAIRSRSGTAGIDRLTDVSTPVQASFAPGSLPGKVTVGATPVLADAGAMSNDVPTLRRFGTNVLGGTAAGGSAGTASGTARGVALDAGYAFRDVSVDVGSTPLGFRTSNVAGGVSFAPALTDNLRLRITGERRPVTDSVLSWGGERDPRTGRIWGGVMRSGVHGQLEYTTGPMTVYAGGGYSLLTGTSVSSNNRAEGGAGFSYSIIKHGDTSLTAGADITYLAYQKNLSNFTFGQGGYFSPQSYAGVSLPLDYRDKIGNLSYHLGATLGYASWHSRASSVFPNDPGYQSALVAASASDPTLATAYPGQSRSGLTGGVRGDVDYALTPTLSVGATASYERTADWNEARAMLYLKQRLEP